MVCSPRLCIPGPSDLCLQIEAVLLDLQAALSTLGQGWLSSNEYVPASTVSWPSLHIRMTDNSVWEPVVCQGWYWCGGQVCCLPVCWGSLGARLRGGLGSGCRSTKRCVALSWSRCEGPVRPCPLAERLPPWGCFPVAGKHTGQVRVVWRIWES